MNLQTFKTASSVWTFDMDDKTFVRTPIVEGAEHPRVAYVSEAIPFIFVSAMEDGRVFVQTGEGPGSYIISGTVVSGGLQ